MDGSPCPPSVLIESGNGLQALWQLDRPVDPLTGKRLVARMTQLLRLRNDRLDLASVLRCPDTYNDGNLVRIAYLEAGMRYSAVDLNETLPALNHDVRIDDAALVAAADVDDFLDQYTADEYPGALVAAVRGVDATVRRQEGARHPSLRLILWQVLREAMVGAYPARQAVEQVVAQWRTHLTNDERRPRNEVQHLLAWQVSRARRLTAAELAPIRQRLDETFGLTNLLPPPADARPAVDSNGEIVPPTLDAKVAAAVKRIRARNLGLRDELPPARPLIHGVLDLGILFLLYARWGCFKSFLGIDWGFHVATGTPWMGHPVERRPFVILGYEAPLSLHRRARAWCAYHGVQRGDLDGWFYLDRRPRPLTDPIENAAMRHYLDDIGAGFVMVDTIARASVGVKANTDEMLVVYEAMSELVTDSRSLLGIGHAGKDPGRGMRGFSGQEDWAEALFALHRERNSGGPHGPATLTNPKQKDRDQLSAVLFNLQVVDLGDGGPTSAVIVPVNPIDIVATDRPTTVEETAHALVVDFLQETDTWQRIPVVAERCKRTNPKARIKITRADIGETISRLVDLGAIERNDRHEVRLTQGFEDE